MNPDALEVLRRATCQVNANACYWQAMLYRSAGMSEAARDATREGDRWRAMADTPKKDS